MTPRKGGQLRFKSLLGGGVGGGGVGGGGGGGFFFQKGVAPLFCDGEKGKETRKKRVVFLFGEKGKKSSTSLRERRKKGRSRVPKLRRKKKKGGNTKCEKTHMCTTTPTPKRRKKEKRWEHFIGEEGKGETEVGEGRNAAPPQKGR